MLGLLRAFRVDGPRCTRCGGTDFYPDPGPAGALLGLFGLGRHACRSCGHVFWLRSSVHEPHVAAGPQPLGAGPTAPQDRPDPAEIDAALDDTAPSASRVVADLSALDAEIARLREETDQPPPPPGRRRGRR